MGPGLAEDETRGVVRRMGNCSQHMNTSISHEPVRYAAIGFATCVICVILAMHLHYYNAAIFISFGAGMWGEDLGSRIRGKLS